MEIGNYWRTIIDSAQEGIIIVDPKGRFVAANRSAQMITGYSEDELKGKSCRILNCTGCKINESSEGGLWCALFSAGIIRDKKCLITNIQNQSVPIVKSATVLYDDQGNIQGAVETLRDISENIHYQNELNSIKRLFHLDDGFHGIIGKTPKMQSLFELIENVAQSDTPVLILGESGTGKEMVAKALHESGPRKARPFLKVNCAALSENLLESELFGHVKGAYTGADQKRVGRFEEAHQGTIFLDEIGDIPLSVQVKLLRVLEDKMIQRVGENKSVPVDVRIITATNRNLEEMIQNGQFREDLFFRINVFPVSCPPLRERRDDIPMIVQHFVGMNVKKTGKNILGFTPEAMNLMVAYTWPGNIRELRNVVEYAFVLSNKSSIGPEHLPEKLINRSLESYAERPDATHVQNRSFDTPTAVVSPRMSKKDRLIHALQMYHGNQTEAAKYLNVSRVTVWKQIKKFGIDLDTFISS
ncbi:MAG: PAS domain S-box protein [Desulfobacteraceae bacterium]|nr:MAG: PAS domain S-box protein [Desulfobacteraceae bacterium]